nr:N-acetylmuramoyl-L-alanine amidase [Kineothrix sp. MSJ-39]
MAKKVTIRLRKEAGGKQLDRQYFQKRPILQNISFVESEVKEEQDTILFTFVLNQPQEASVHLQQETVGTEAEITLQAPVTLYDRIVVLDAGHGGSDAGETAMAQDVSLQEKDITLATVKKAGELLSAQGIQIYYTREDDSDRSGQDRVDFANALQADMLISVHVTSTEDTTVYGIQTEYNAQYFIPDFSSADLAYLLLTKVAETTNEKALDIISGQDDNAVIRDAMIPVAQLDMGFLSNQQERKLLQKDAYTEKVAQGICDAVLLAYKEMGK